MGETKLTGSDTAVGSSVASLTDAGVLWDVVGTQCIIIIAVHTPGAIQARR